jgi:hypothetical protein
MCSMVVSGSTGRHTVSVLCVLLSIAHMHTAHYVLNFSFCFIILHFIMTPTTFIGGDKVKVVGGTSAGHSAVVLKVTKHMVQLQLLRCNVCNGNEFFNPVPVMKGNVEKASGS